MIGIIWVLFGVVILAYYNALLIIDNNIPDTNSENIKIKERWHFVGAILFIFISITSWYNWGFWYAPLTLSCFWALFGGIVHKVALNRPFFFVGTTAKTDRVLRKIFPNNPQKASAIIKISVLILSIIAIIIF
jgi:hypothetical protein